MEFRRFGLVQLLLVGLLAGVASTTRTYARDPAEYLDTTGRIIAAPGAPTTPCCDAVLTSVSGGDPCLCLTSPDASHGAAPAALSPSLARGGGGGGGRRGRPPADEPPCNATLMASQLERDCRANMTTAGVPAPACCGDVLRTIDHKDRGCLCSVSEQYVFSISELDVGVMWLLYQRCGGRQQAVPKRPDTCAHSPAAAPPPPPPPPQSPPPPAAPEPPSRPPPSEQTTRSTAGWSWRVFGIVMGSLAGAAVIAVPVWIVKYKKKPPAAEMMNVASATVVESKCGAVDLPVKLSTDAAKEILQGGGLPAEPPTADARRPPAAAPPTIFNSHLQDDGKAKPKVDLWINKDPFQEEDFDSRIIFSARAQ